MDADQFAVLLREASCEDLVNALNPLDELTRKSLLKVVKSVRRQAHRESGDAISAASEDEWQQRQEIRNAWKAANPFTESNVAFGLLACGTAADAQRVHRWHIDWEQQRLIAPLLIARNPRWLKTWVTRSLTREAYDLSWRDVRAMIEAGVIDKPSVDGYAGLFISAMRDEYRLDSATFRPISERLLDEPEFLEDEVWRIFEFENHALTTDWTARHERGPDNYETWPDALQKLAQEGHLDRQRLLDVTMAGQHRDLKQNQLGAYGKLHQALDPDIDEIKARESGYLGLLVSPVGPVLTFATKMVERLHRAGKLDATAFSEAAPSVFSHKGKGTSIRVLKITAQIVSGQPSFSTLAAGIAIAAMSHESTDVQALALDILEDQLPDANATTREQFIRQIPFLTEKFQQRAAAMAGLAKTINDDADRGTDIPSVSAEALAELPASVRKVFGLEGADFSRMPPMLDYCVDELPGVIGCEYLAPIESRDELLELAAQLLERVESPEQVEQLIDGIARLGQDRSGNFAKLSKPLIERLNTGHMSVEGLVTGGGAAQIALIDLLLTWWSSENYDSRSVAHYYEPPQTAFSVARIREVKYMLIADEPRSLLSMPSHRGGWIDPATLVDRLLFLKEENREAFRYDLMQALLRLGPGNRIAALSAAEKLAGLAGRATRFALGGDSELDPTDQKYAEIWLCAARARDPTGDIAHLLESIEEEFAAVPGALDATEWDWGVRVQAGDGYRRADIEFPDSLFLSYKVNIRALAGVDSEATAPPPGPDWSKWPTAAIRARPKELWYATYQYNSPWLIRAHALQHPSDAESLMSLAVRMLGFRIDEDTSRDTPVHQFFTSLFDSTRPWGPMSILAVCLGLLSRSSDSRGFAIDALIPAIESGHADCGRFSATFARLLSGDAYKVNRFAPAMNAILDVSNLHKWWVAQLIERLVVDIDILPKVAFGMSEVALDCMVALGAKPGDEMRNRLKKYKGSSKTAKFARELLALEGWPLSAPPDSVLALAWQGRLQLARTLADV